MLKQPQTHFSVAIDYPQAWFHAEFILARNLVKAKTSETEVINTNLSRW